jgi:hypothetical protein
MKARLVLGIALVVGLLGVGTFASRGDASVNAPRQWAIVNILDPVSVKGEIVMGPVMIVHDDEKMARGEPCTTFYRFDAARGPREELVSFHCTPVQRSVAGTTKLTLQHGIEGACKRLIEYQFAGDTEAHGIPSK